MVKQVKLPLVTGMPIKVLVQVQAAQLSIQLAGVCGKVTEDGPNDWITVTHV